MLKQHFKPQKVKASPFKLLLGNWFVDDVSTKDHSGSVYTTTFTTIGKYLKNNNLLSKAVVLKTDGNKVNLAGNERFYSEVTCHPCSRNLAG